MAKQSQRELTVELERDEEGWWTATIPGVQGVVSDGRTIAAAMRRVRDALGGILDDERAARSAALVPNVKLSERLAAARDRVRAKRVAAEAAALEARTALIDGARAFEAAGISLRDAAQLLDYSFQRIDQALKANTKPGPGKRAKRVPRTAPTHPFERHVEF